MSKSRSIVVAALVLAGCGDEKFAKVYRIEQMGQAIGGPAAAARPGDFMLENDRVRAVIHGRPNQRSTMPIANGSLMDLDLQRPLHANSVGKGRDAFYELGPMVNLKVSGATELSSGMCTMQGDAPSVGVSPCPAVGCGRVAVGGTGDNIIGMLALLDLAIQRNFDASKLQVLTDWDLCPGEPFVRVTTTARLDGKAGQPQQMLELNQRTGLLEVLLGETTGKICVQSSDCQTGESCDPLLIEGIPGLNTQMRRCRKPDQMLAGALAGDFILFSGKAGIFIPGNGFDNESYVRSLFDAGGDVFSNPLSRPFLAGVAADVSYAYFNETGQMMVPIFSEAFTAAMSNRFGCAKKDPDCLKGKELRFTRYVSVGHGDVASALEGYYTLRKIATGRVEGHVIQARTSKPLSRIDVYAFAIPKAWQDWTTDKLGAVTVDDLMQQHRQETSTADNPGGEPGLVSHFRTDVAVLDSIPDGSFAGPLPEGRYLLTARQQGRPASRLVPVQVIAGKTSGATLLVGEPAYLEYQVVDQAGLALPAKLTIGHCFPECARDEDCSGDRPSCDKATRLCVPAGGYSGPATCRPDQYWGQDPIGGNQTCVCPITGRLPLALGGKRLADGTIQTVLSENGRGTVELEPSTMSPPVSYQVIVSRGFEYEIKRTFVSSQPSTMQRLAVSLRRLVDTTGWISADFHVHGPNSVDSGLDHETRIRSYAAEGVELVSASDHDHLTDYAPTIQKLGLDYWMKSQIGLEVSPLDYGHFIGFPLQFDQNKELNGAFHWRTPDEAVGWRNLTPGEIFTKLRSIGSLGTDRTVVFIAHFYDNFTFYSIDPWTMEPPALNITAIFNTVLAGQNFSGEFDALEALNGKNLDIIRRPTYKEIADYNRKLAAFVADPATPKLPYDEKQRRWGELSAAAQREFIIRTPEEQKTAIDYDNPSFDCRCTQDLECGEGWLCDIATAACIAGCTGDSNCDPTLVTAGREKCLAAFGGSADRKTCLRVAKSCSADADCTGIGKETCVAADPAKPTEKTCELSCVSDSGCKVDKLRPVCDTARGYCAPSSIRAAKQTDPCPTVRGTLDDWFQLLNHGIRRPILGNSDSHSVYDTEAGIPRNYVQLDADRPPAIDTTEVAARVKAMRSMPSYGPFVEVTLNGKPMGSVVGVASNGETVQLRIRVQSATWFDVDRLELYRNGDLIKVVEGRVDCPARSTDCIPVPNRQVVVYDAIVEDKPTVDSWYVVVAMGVDGRSLAPVYSSTPVARLGMYELIQRLTPLLPPLRSFRTPLSPSMAIVRPYAVTNPVWVDLGGDGLTPLKGLPSWAPPRDVPSTSSALKQEAPDAHDHDHRRGLGRLRSLAAGQTNGGISADAIRQALDSLRFLH
jgi:hypothetical protein